MKDNAPTIEVYAGHKEKQAQATERIRSVVWYTSEKNMWKVTAQEG
jgi:hypothetical protein